MDESVTRKLTNYLQNPCPESFLDLRVLVAESPGYNPGNEDEMTLHELLEQKDYQGAAAFISSIMPRWCLSPRMYLHSAFVSNKLGDSNSAQIYYFLAQRFLDSILQTGDGSEDRPYLVMQVADEYVVLARLGKESSVQRLVSRGEGRSLDALECHDGSVVWFDVSLLMGHYLPHVT